MEISRSIIDGDRLWSTKSRCVLSGIWLKLCLIGSSGRLVISTRSWTLFNDWASAKSCRIICMSLCWTERHVTVGKNGPAAYSCLLFTHTGNVITNDSSTDTVSFAYVVIIDKYWPYVRSFIESINSFMKTSRIATLMILRHQFVLHMLISRLTSYFPRCIW